MCGRDKPEIARRQCKGEIGARCILTRRLQFPRFDRERGAVQRRRESLLIIRNFSQRFVEAQTSAPDDPPGSWRDNAFGH
jgi:hypothetical protein